jgi:hypothetical protein
VADGAVVLAFADRFRLFRLGHSWPGRPKPGTVLAYDPPVTEASVAKAIALAHHDAGKDR